MSYIVKVDDKEYKIDIDREGNAFTVHLDEKDIRVDIAAPYQDSRMSLVIGNKLYSIVFDSENHVVVNEEEYATAVSDEYLHKLMMASPSAGQKHEATITVPMPGLVVELEVKEGDSVKAGQGLLIVEAMKMQNEIKAPKDGVVKKILIKKGQSVNSREKLMVIE
jgi:biotin carboxyl carrier protein